jgi:hypothetical protein
LLEPPCRIGQMRSRSLALGSRFPPYLVLLRVGFTLPPALPLERCALTAPFHPYPSADGQTAFRGVLRRGLARAVYFLWYWPSTDPRESASRTLSGTLPCGVRTFLPRKRWRLHVLPPAATARSSCQCLVYPRCDFTSCGREFRRGSPLPVRAPVAADECAGLP